MYKSNVYKLKKPCIYFYFVQIFTQNVNAVNNFVHFQPKIALNMNLYLNIRFYHLFFFAQRTIIK